MADVNEFILGEFDRTLDERYRLSVPTELVQALGGEDVDLILAKERPGCLSLWNGAIWQERLDAGVSLVKGKIRAGRLEGRAHGGICRFARLEPLAGGGLQHGHPARLVRDELRPDQHAAAA